MYIWKIDYNAFVINNNITMIAIIRSHQIQIMVQTLMLFYYLQLSSHEWTVTINLYFNTWMKEKGSKLFPFACHLMPAPEIYQFEIHVVRINRLHTNSNDKNIRNITLPWSILIVSTRVSRILQKKLSNASSKKLIC